MDIKINRKMNKTTLIKHPQFGELRTIKEKGDTLFCAADVCEILGMTATTDVTLRKLDDDEKTTRKIHWSCRQDENLTRKIYGSGQHREMWFVTESGLYALILRSNKPEARKFRKWITSEVLPSIRKFGFYVHSSCMDKKMSLALTKMMSVYLGKYITAEDLKKTAKKFGMDRWDVHAVMTGVREDNAVMQCLQDFAMNNKEKEINAYHPDRIKEVIDKLTIN
jgi:prophage antirepressor-like protein